MSAAFPSVCAPTRGQNLFVRIFGFEGPYEVFVLDSLTAAAVEIEAIDVENEEYVFFADDGTLIDAAV